MAEPDLATPAGAAAGGLVVAVLDRLLDLPRAGRLVAGLLPMIWLSAVGR